jgi:hypothetical protein
VILYCTSRGDFIGKKKEKKLTPRKFSKEQIGKRVLQLDEEIDKKAKQLSELKGSRKTLFSEYLDLHPGQSSIDDPWWMSYMGKETK